MAEINEVAVASAEYDPISPDGNLAGRSIFSDLRNLDLDTLEESGS
jgi:hypothetical protein